MPQSIHPPETGDRDAEEQLEQQQVRRVGVRRWLERWHVPTAQVTLWRGDDGRDVLHRPRPEASSVAGALWWHAVRFAGPGHVYDPVRYLGRVTPSWTPPLARLAPADVGGGPA